MKQLLSMTLVFALVLSLCACGASKESTAGQSSNQKAHNSDIEEAAEAVQDAFKEFSDHTPDIVKSGTYNGNDVLIEGLSRIELDSWYLGQSGHILTEGNECLCLKLVIYNLSSETKPIYELLQEKVYIDGASYEIYEDHFFMNGITSLSNIQPGAKAEYYINVDCSVNGTHTIDIDISSETEERIGTISFEIS